MQALNFGHRASAHLFLANGALGWMPHFYLKSVCCDLRGLLTLCECCGGIKDLWGFQSRCLLCDAVRWCNAVHGLTCILFPTAHKHRICQSLGGSETTEIRSFASSLCKQPRREGTNAHLTAVPGHTYSLHCTVLARFAIYGIVKFASNCIHTCCVLHYAGV